MATKANGKVDALGGDVSNAGAELIEMTRPYTAAVTIQGTAALLFHRWQSDSVEEKAAAAKGSAAKKTDDVESYVWRNPQGYLCLPGEYVRGSIINPQKGAAKYRQDPRSPRKSALDLFTAGVVSTDELAVLLNAAGKKTKTWDYIDRRRAVIQRNAITRSRPCFHAGWQTTVTFSVLLPQYIAPALLHDVLTDAGRFVGVGDFRPTFGRFQVTKFDVGMA